MAGLSGEQKRARKSNEPLVRIAIFVVCVFLITLSKSDIVAVNSLRGAIVSLALPIVNIVAAPVQAIGGFFSEVQSVANLRNENQRLRNDVENLSQWRLKAERLQLENRQLRSINNVVLPLQATPISARVTAINADNFTHSVIINVGSLHGVKKGHAAVTADGLVGLVVELGERHSQVLLLTDINAMIPVIFTSSSWTAVTVGRNTKFLDLRFLPGQASLTLGELVQTSGHGGVLPPGIPVGRVISIAEDGSATIAPVADLQRLSFVTVLLTAESPAFAADDLANQAYTPLQEAEEEFSLKGLTVLGQRKEDDLDIIEDEQ